MDSLEPYESLGERLNILEGTVSFQERTIEDLNQVIVRQQEQMDRLEARLRSLSEQLSSGGPFVRSPDEEEPPPHY